MTVEVPKGNPDKIIRNHVIGAMGVGLIPMPLVDLAALTGIQLNLLRKLAKKYDIPFSQDKGKNVLSALLGSSLPIPIGGMLASLIKTIPVVGQTTGSLALPVTAGASTYAIGKVFVQHFESGGTFLTFDPAKVKDYYAKMYKEGEKVASDMKQEKVASDMKQEEDKKGSEAKTDDKKGPAQAKAKI